MIASLATAGWRVAGASVCGSSHLKSGTPCQDAYRSRIISDSVLIAAVCDGAGSARLSHLGARTAADAAVESLCAAFDRTHPSMESEWRKCLEEAEADALLKLQDLAVVEKCVVKDLATTLLLVAAGPGFTAALQIGDGAIVVRRAEDQLDLLTRPENGEYANETTFLTSERAKPQIAIAKPCDGLALFSDGIQRLALRFPAVQPHEPFFRPLFSFLDGTEEEEAQNRAMSEFLAAPRLSALTDDDVTLLVAKRRYA